MNVEESLTYVRDQVRNLLFTACYQTITSMKCVLNLVHDDYGGAIVSDEELSVKVNQILHLRQTFAYLAFQSVLLTGHHHLPLLHYPPF